MENVYFVTIAGFLTLGLTTHVQGTFEILVEEPRSGSIWVWHTYKSSSGAGWNSPSLSRSWYSVCDVMTETEPRNWLISDFIDVTGIKVLHIEEDYQLLNCPADVGPYCKTYIGLYAFHTNITNVKYPNPTKGMFSKEDKIQPKTLPVPGNRRKYTYQGRLATLANGIYLALLDKGACIILSKVVISYSVCPEKVMRSVLVRFPRTVAPANYSELTEQLGECTDVNSISTGKLLGVCLSSGEWNISDNVRCVCKAGYELVNASDCSHNGSECEGTTQRCTIATPSISPSTSMSESCSSDVSCSSRESASMATTGATFTSLPLVQMTSVAAIHSTVSSHFSSNGVAASVTESSSVYPIEDQNRSASLLPNAMLILNTLLILNVLLAHS